MGEERESERSRAWRLFDLALELQNDGQLEASASAYGELLRDFGGSRDVEVRLLVASGMSNQGSALVSVGRPDDAVAVYEELGGMLADADDPRLRALIPWSLYGKGNSLAQSGRIDEAFAVLDDVVQRFTDEDAACAAQSRLRKAQLLASCGRTHEATAAFEELVRQYDGDKTPMVVRLVQEARDALASSN